MKLNIFKYFNDFSIIWRFLLFFIIFSWYNFAEAQTKQENSSDSYVYDLIKKSEASNDTNIEKSLSYLKEALKLENEVLDSTLLELYKKLGVTYKNRASYYIALSYFFKELEIKKKVLPSETFFELNNIGGCYFLLEDYEKAYSFWSKALEGYKNYQRLNENDVKLKDGSLIYNNLAVLESRNKNFAKALEMLNQFKAENEVLKDTINLILSYENLADVHVKLKEPKIALEKLWIGVSLSKKINSNYDLLSLENAIGEIYLNEIKLPDSAYYYLQKSYDLSNEYGFYDLKLKSANNLVSFYEKKEDYKNALNYLHASKSLSEDIIDSENTKNVDRLEFEFNEKNRQQEEIVNQKKRANLYIFSTVLFCLFSIIILLMFKLQKNISLKKVAENKVLSKELEEKNKTIKHNSIKMMQTSKIIQSAHKGLKELKSSTHTTNRKELSQIISDLKTSSKNFNQIEFEKTFMQIDGDFYKRLLQEYPDLTKNELRLCVFLKLNLSSKEISSITHQTPHSIVVARSRLRKKLNLKKSNQSLTNFFIQF